MSPHLIHSGRRSVRGFTLIELVIAFFIVAVLISLLLPATRRGREPARRTMCKSNLKQIGLALHNYHDYHGCFPPAYTVDAEGNPLHSWRTLILPYLTHSSLYNQLDLSKPWDDPANAELLKAIEPTYRCPSSIVESHRTNYLAVVTPGSVFGSLKSRSISEITDDTGSTIMIIEVPEDQVVPWYAPQDADESVLQSLVPKAKRQHFGGEHALMADGTVRFLSEDIAAETFQALITADVGDKVGDY